MPFQTVWRPGTRGTAEQLNASSIWGVMSVPALQALETTGWSLYASQSPLLFHLSAQNTYQWASIQELPADGDLFINSSYTGQYRSTLSNGDRAAIWLADDIQETLPIVTAVLNFGTVSANSVSGILTVSVPGARPGDFVNVQNGLLPAGVFVQYSEVTDKDVVSVRLWNGASGSQSVGAVSYTFLITTQNRLPAFTARSVQFLYDLMDPDTYTNVELEDNLSSDINQMHFRLLLASQRRRQILLGDSNIKTHIQNSATANSIMEDYEGAGY